MSVFTVPGYGVKTVWDAGKTSLCQCSLFHGLTI